jgi:hypothetical protein
MTCDFGLLFELTNFKMHEPQILGENNIKICVWFFNHNIFWDTWSSHGNKYSDYGLLGWHVM